MQQLHDATLSECRHEMPSSRSLPLGSTDDVPLFSPNQASSQEEVLHSIFSPYAGPPPKTLSTGANERVPLVKMPTGATQTQSATGTGVRLASTIQISPLLPSSSEIMSYGQSPYSAKEMPQYPFPSKFLNAVTTCNSFESAASNDNAWLVLSTPTGGRQAMYFASPISEISALSDRSFKSFLGIPNIEMLSFDFVKQCTSQELLQKIISVLTKEDKFPGLLRAARHRWNAIVTVPNDLPTPTASLPILPPKSQMWWMGWKNSQQQTQQNECEAPNDSTLVMSLSDSSCLAGEGLSEKTESPSIAFGESTIDGTKRKEAPPVGSVLPSVTTATDPVSNDNVAISKPNSESNKNSFSRDPDVNNYAIQFARLTKAKDEAERRMKSLEEIASKSTNRTRELGQMVDSLKKQNQQLQQRAKDDKAARDRAIKEANHTKDRFQRVLKELNDRLTQATEQERQIQSHQRDKAELNNMLKDSMRQFATLKREQDAMIFRLARVINRKDIQIHNMDDRERKSIIDEAAKKISSGSAAATALTEAFESAEFDRRTAEQALANSQAQLKKCVSSQRRLERENLLLSQRVHRMSEELASNNEQIDKLIQSARIQQRKEWTAQELHYQKVIQHLKQQLRSEEAMVSTKLYEAQVNEARKRESECYDKNRQIKNLAAQVATLEKKLQATVKAPPPPPPPPPPTRSKPALAIVTNTKTLAVQAVDKENAPPSTVSKIGPQPVGLKQSTRSAIVQRAGGRKALLAQVKQMRSPKFASAM